jgi:hypothetical protein
MRRLETRDFNNNEAWLIFRLDARVADEYLDIYIVMHLPSTLIGALKISFKIFKPITEINYYDQISAFRLGNQKFIKKQS